MALAAIFLRHIVACKIKDIVKEYAVFLAEVVGGFLVLALGEGGVGFEIVADITPSALDEMSCKLATDAFAFRAIQVGGQICKVAIEQAQKRTEGILIAAVRC